MLPAARPAPPTMSSDWTPVGQPQIGGVVIREVRNVVFRNGVLTELLRTEWFDPPLDVRHMVHVTMLPGSASAWHCHLRQRDIIFPIMGQIRIGLYDDREESASFRQSLILDAGIMRPMSVEVPTGVWHALRNPTREPAAYVVVNDQPYVYDAPDDWIIPMGHEAIPCSLD